MSPIPALASTTQGDLDKATPSLVDSVKNNIVGTIKGTGEILNAVTDAVSDVLTNTLKSTGKVGGPRLKPVMSHGWIDGRQPRIRVQ